MTRIFVFAAAIAVYACVATPICVAQSREEASEDERPVLDDGSAPPNERPAAAPVTDDSTDLYKKALEVQKKGRFAAAQKALRDLLEKFPGTVHKKAALERSEDNAFAGCEMLHSSGPKERRIDVSVMGDGFTIDSPDQALQQKWAKLCLDVLWNETAYSEYRDYFNFYFVRLISLEEGVDPSLSPEEKKKIEEKNKTRTRKKKTDFSTALDCKAAGPQGQVMADRRLVYKWLRVAAREEPGCEDDGLVVAFARFGILGMGGGGIANVGRPDKSITVHEFGHAFGGLLDEYAVNPMKPMWPVQAPNASTTPDPLKVPWAHFLAKKVAGVGVFEGGATFQKGVWRPARSCAMNSAGQNAYCPVCREAVILRIYRYVNPIDASGPSTTEEIQIKEDSPDTLFVIPMQPEKHALSVTWYVEAKTTAAPGQRGSGATGGAAPAGGIDLDEIFREGRMGRFTGGRRGDEDRSAYDAPPPGTLARGDRQKKIDGNPGVRHEFAPGRLDPGRYRITAVVKDPTPWVLKDVKHLLEERKTWIVTVLPKS
jgi:hypothetical protein